MTESLSLLLAERILEIVRESGANRDQASRAIKTAEIMLPELGLKHQPTAVIET